MPTNSRSKRPMPERLYRDWRSLAFGPRVWILLKMLWWGFINGRDQEKGFHDPVALGWAWG